MNIEEFREYCLSLKGTTEAMPFDDQVLVFKVMSKMYALTNIETFESINVKCNPEIAVELREKYTSVIEGYHMHKKYWNTLLLNGELTDKQIKHWITHSYEQVVAKMPKKLREELKRLEG